MYNLLNLAIMKTIDEILNRNDYKKLTYQLESRTQEVATRIRQKLIELDEEDTIIKIKGERPCYDVLVTVKSVYGRRNYHYLAMNCEYYQNYNSSSWLSLESIGGYYTPADDFGVCIEGAPRNAALRFLNVARQIIEKIGEKEENKVNSINTALSEIKDL